MAQTNKALNISDVNQWREENQMVIEDDTSDDAANIRTMLCMPIVNANKDVIGVAQLINKVKIAIVISERKRLGGSKVKYLGPRI